MFLYNTDHQSINILMNLVRAPPIWGGVAIFVIIIIIIINAFSQGYNVKHTCSGQWGSYRHTHRMNHMVSLLHSSHPGPAWSFSIQSLLIRVFTHWDAPMHHIYSPEMFVLTTAGALLMTIDRRRPAWLWLNPGQNTADLQMRASLHHTIALRQDKMSNHLRHKSTDNVPAR